jgi:cysteinyl-tRNA synthetase
MPVRIYSTLSGREDPLEPLHPDGVLRIYACGMTPKFHPHVGHARTFVALDVIRRYLVYRGFTVKYVQNFTDIDDKIIQRANREGHDAETTARNYIESYFEVMDRLNVKRADEYPTVTGYMPKIVEFVGDLVETNHAYETNGDVWFDVKSFPDYGKLSKRDLNSQLTAARKELEPGKRDPRDFALWKSAKPDEPSWDSPWGKGRPGWHIECSAMVRETLGDQIDIHGGGADLIFPHHENEIAQSESLTGKVPFVRHWVHGGLLTIGGEKMAHSTENFLTLASLLEQYTPTEIRFYLLRTHYRSSLLFAIDAEDGQGATVRGIEESREALGRLRRAVGTEPLPDGDLEQSTVDAFAAAMDADFNTPVALSAIFDLVREVNRRRETGSSDLDRGRRTIVHLLDVLGIDLFADAAGDQRSIEPFVNLLLDVRRQLREARQWQLSDFVRDGLGKLGVTVKDRPDGTSDWEIDR